MSTSPICPTGCGRPPRTPRSSPCPTPERWGLSGPFGGRRGFAVINAYTVAFFDEALRGRTALVLSEPIRGTVVESRS
jgi:hypothetical protein